MNDVIATSPKKSDVLSKEIFVPGRIAMSEIDSNRLNQAASYVGVVQSMVRSGKAQESDVCEAERYYFEATAAYSLKSSSGLQQSMTKALKVDDLMAAIKEMGEVLGQVKKQNEEVKKQNEEIKNQNEEVKDQIEDLNKQTQENTKEIAKIGSQLRNDRIRKCNNEGYSLYQKRTESYGDLSILPLTKECVGQMDVKHLRLENDDMPVLELLHEAPLVGKTYEATPATWSDLFSMSHWDILKMCQWYNEDMGIVQGHSQEQRRRAVAAWFTGRNPELDEAGAASVDAESSSSPPDQAP